MHTKRTVPVEETVFFISLACEYPSTRGASSDEFGVLAQLGEHLPYKQRVTGSSPVGPTSEKNADVAQLAEQLICNQQVIGSSPIIGLSKYSDH